MTVSTLLASTVRRGGLLLALAAMLTAPDADAQTTYVVTSERDQTAANAAVPNGEITLREALIAANTDAAFGDAPAGNGADIITFDPAVTGVLVSRGELEITEGVTIGNGTSGPQVTIGARTNAPTRLFNITSFDPVVLQSLVLRDGFSAMNGGAVLLGGGGELELTNVQFLGNRAENGGGLYTSPESITSLSGVSFEGNRANGDGSDNGGGALYAGGDVSGDPFSGLTFTNNFASVGSGSGGAIYVGETGTFTAAFLIAEGQSAVASKGLVGPFFSGNRAARAGGAVEVRDGGSFLISAAGFFDNRAGNAPGNGGALHITGAGSAVIDGSTVANNFARSEGGGLWNSGTGTLNVFGTTVSNNSTVGDGGGVYQQEGESGTTLIANSTISGNTASRFGGGLFAEGAMTTVQNSTVSGNSAQRGGGGYATGASVTFESATVAANTAAGQGGGFANPDIGNRVQLQNTLVADNSAPSGPQLSGYYNSQGNNLVETRSGAGIRNTSPGTDLYETDAMIGPLADNGGPTQTHALLAGSPAIDAGMTDLMEDQRFEPRTNPDDIGAFDFGAAAAGAMLITGVFDGPLTGGLPKVVELYVTEDIADLGLFGLGSANNGGGTDGEEFSFPDGDTATAGDFIYVATGTAQFQLYFGIPADYDGGSATNVNGDDAIELFQNDAVVDVYGDIAVDGSGQPWDYLDGWAYRTDGTGPDGTTFVLGNWTYSGINVNDGKSTNTNPDAFPIGTYDTIVPPSADGDTFASTRGAVTGLAPVAPNPIRSSGRVQFAVAQSEAVTVDLYDVMGRRVQSLYTGTPTAETVVDVTIDASGLASGVYVVVLSSQTTRETQRVTIAR